MTPQIPSPNTKTSSDKQTSDTPPAATIPPTPNLTEYCQNLENLLN